MKLHRSPGPNPALLFLAPALNVLLVLIFFLLLTSPFLLQPGIAVNVPNSPFILSPQRNPRIISVTAPPSSSIYFENQPVTLTNLREKLANLRGRSQTIIVKADGRALYDAVSSVMNVALELGFPVVLATTPGQVKP